MVDHGGGGDIHSDLPLADVGDLVAHPAGRCERHPARRSKPAHRALSVHRSGFGFWSYFVISILHAPLYIGLIAIGATIAIGIVSIINRRWKISAHLTGFGGLVGGILCFYYGNGMLPGAGTICVLAILSLLLMYARLYLHAHTSAQVCAGWLLGITCTFVPYYLLVAYVS